MTYPQAQYRTGAAGVPTLGLMEGALWPPWPALPGHQPPFYL